MSFIDRLRDRLFGFSTRDSMDSAVDGHIVRPVNIRNDIQSSIDDENSSMDVQKHDEKAGFPDRVMFVCSGNLCRSAYGEYRFKSMIAESHPDTKVISSGTLRIVGRKASDEMIATGKERGLDLEPHRSQALSRLLVDASDIIFAMTERHRDEILRIAPNSESKIVLLGMWLKNPQSDIEDPMGRSIDVYRKVTAQIDEALERWYQIKNK